MLLNNFKKFWHRTHIIRTHRGNGNRTHNDGFEDHNFATKLFPYYKIDLTKTETHLKKSKHLFKRVCGSYNLYLIIFGKIKDPTNAIKNHHKYEKLKENLKNQ